MLKLKVFTVNVFQENCFILSDESREALVLDPGAATPAEQQAVADYIAQEGLAPTVVLSTHGHLDHNFGAYDLYRRFGLPTTIHEADALLLESIDRQVARFGGLRLGPLPTPIVGRKLKDGDSVTFGHCTLDVIHTPGHTPGGICLYCKDEHLLFAGDTLFAGSIGRTDLDGGSLPQLLSSIRSRLFSLPDETDVLSGHGPSTTIGSERRSNPYLT